MPLEVGSLVIPDRELELSFVRSSGPGGQNVNKVSTAVQLRFALARSTTLSAPAKSRLRALAGRRLTEEGDILIIARNHRTQEQNRREALSRLAGLIERALVVPRARKPTRPSRAAREQRLEAKGRRRRTKEGRQRVKWED